MIIQPEWIGMLLHEWRRADWAPRSMSYPGAASFAQHAGDEDWSSSGYSQTEVLAIAAAVERLQVSHPEHWRVLNRAMRPGAASQIPERPGDHQLLAEVGPMLARLVDELLE